METTKLKRFATEARARLRAGVATKIRSLGFDAEGNAVPGMEPTPMVGGCTWNGQILPSAFAEQWEALRRRLKAKGFKEVVEEGAYTWFNRLMAIRILSMNGIAEPVLRFVDEARTPKIVDDARQGRVITMPDQQLQRLRKLFDDPTRINEQFALLVTEFCHQTPILQACFGSLADYTELLLPNNILDKGGFIEMLNTADFITEADYKSAELIGWLYQFYISDRKDEVFAKKGKVEADEIPAATQIFTPNWIVKYMVQNAVFPQVRSNRLPEEDKTYLIDKEAPEEPKKPKDLKVADLACGSGHILNECFDLLYDLYIASGFGRGEAIESIFANNLLGIDIDERARQLATFALMLKACQRDESFADAHILPRILTAPDMPESVENPEDYLPHFFLGNYDKEIAEAWKLVKDAHTLGSIIKFDISPVTRSKMEQKVKEWRSESDIPYGIQLGLPIMDFILALTDSYDAIVMNPPYMGGGKMDNILVKYVKDIYPDSKADLMTVFMEVAIKRTVKGGFWAMINLPSWMFLSSFEALRINIIKTQQIVCLNHNGRGVFGSDFGSVTFVVQNIEPYKEGIYKRLFTEHVQVRSNEVIHQLYLKDSTVYESRQSNFLLIPGTPIGYWLSKPMLENFGANRVGDEMVTREGMATADNERFLRLWSEISIKNFKSFNYTSDKWYPYNKGGQFRKWYGNQDYVVDWSNDGEDIKNNIDPQTGRIRSHNYNGEYAFRKCGTWSAISSGSFSIRYCPEGFLWDSKGACGFSEQNLLYIIGLLNSTVSKEYLKVLAPTVDFKVGDIIRVPLIIENESQILNLTSSCIDVAKADWDAHETSWNFQRNGLLDIDIDKAMAIVNEYSDITGICLDMAALEPTKLEWLVSMNKMNWEAKFIRLHANEEELNRQFIEIYGLQDELNPHVDYEDITILQQGEISLYRPTHGIEFHGGKEEVAKYGEVLEDEGIVIEPQSRILWQDDVLIKQLISYMVGVWMGRYRLDRPGLNIAHHDPTDEEMASYKYGPDNAALVIDDDAIIPILPTGAPFEDNLTEYIANFVRIAWGEASQTDNLNFIEQCLGKKIEDYVQKDFWKDHKKMYQNRPIYWLFSSKKGAFKALVYVHRMHPYTVEQVRTRYLLKYMDWLRSEAQRLEIRDADLTTAERRRLDCLRSDIEECEEYHERLQVVAEQAIPIDLDNGIPANHALFGDILTKLK
ncbi:BREX-1 system adenine-specific DNA-methyltransferase PglX [uncultured Duncaniella sp.]|uniref:BREX-1 system adenine-specific DNA-methyltransferase PglX n=1 Tax=uncultured Duncaniella sp. TaxID=2768039 RepID=UPI0025B75522|nr:BREX-1 system adenine-specific DNA-methyltransferase PglX [uncultured Duncaniella sp.]